MRCPDCGTENREGRRFCVGCGRQLNAACPQCGAASQPGERFCGDCGTPLAGAPPSVQAATSRETAQTAQTERRLVSVLFADLVGFTTLVEGRDPEETRELLGRFFDLARETVERHGGTVEKFIGDAVMAVWGAPVAQEDDAERAVRAALELVSAVRLLEGGLDARAAVLTGEAAVTVGATGQGIVAGDLVNTASRLQAVSPPGAVLVGEATQRAAARAIVFEPVGEQELRGKRAPVAAWRALRVVAERAGRRRAEVLEPPFVGRDDELRLLKDLLHATGRERRTRLVSITGQAGIGKSRLAWEFLKYIDGLTEDIWWHEGRCPSYGEGVTFWALGEMVRRRAGLVEGDDERTTRERIAAAVAEQVPDPQERRWVERALLTLLGVEDPPPGGPEELFAAWRTFFEGMAATGTCVLVFEDLQWADTGLLDFVDHLIEWSRGQPILVVTLARPELLERRPDWGRSTRSFVGLALEPLDAATMRELLSGMVADLPDSSVQAIVERAGGVPLYAVETVRMLAEQGQLVAAGDRYRATGELQTIAVPETLQALVASRLDALGPADRSILQDAAVLGQSFTAASLAAVSGVSPAELEPRLRALVRRELLTMHPDPRSPERGQYVFVQALVREVAYGMLARRDRKTRHLAVARQLEMAEDEERAGALASHYVAAWRNAAEGAETEALATQARIALRAAAARAASLGSPDQALAFLEQALEITVDPEHQADLLERAGEAASMATRHEVAERYFRDAVELRRTLRDRAGAARALAALGAALIDAMRYEEAAAELDSAVEEFADLTEDPSHIALEGQLARAAFLAGGPGRAIAICDRVLPAAERADLVGLVADTLITRGTALCLLGRTYEGFGATRAGIELADASGLRRTALRGRANLGGQLRTTDPRDGLKVSSDALDEAFRLGERSFLAVALENAVECAIDLGEWDVAVEQAQRTLQVDLGDLERTAAQYCALWVRALRGGDIAEEAEPLAAFVRGTALEGEGYAIAYVAALAAGRLRDAYEACMAHWRLHPDEGRDLCSEAGWCALLDRDGVRAAAALAGLDATGVHGRVVSATRLVIRGGLAALEGRVADAMAHFREALGAWRDLGVSWRLALTAIVMATLLDPRDRDVRQAGDEAREILARLGALPYLKRLDVLLGPPPTTPEAVAEAGGATVDSIPSL